MRLQESLRKYGLLYRESPLHRMLGLMVADETWLRTQAPMLSGFDQLFTVAAMYGKVDRGFRLDGQYRTTLANGASLPDMIFYIGDVLSERCRDIGSPGADQRMGLWRGLWADVVGVRVRFDVEDPVLQTVKAMQVQLGDY